MKHIPLAAISVVFLALASMTASQRFVPAAPRPRPATTQVMARYEKAILLLEQGKTELALRALAAAPDETLVLSLDLQEEHLPAVTFLFLGCKLTNEARLAAQKGSVELSQNLLAAGQDLSRRLHRENELETLEERELRRSVAQRLEGLVARTAREVG